MLAPHPYTPEDSICQREGGFILQIDGGSAGAYRLAQMDDYHTLPRTRFKWQMPVTLSLRARVSAEQHAGTWGFGLWNDPFSASLGLGGMARRLPALPNAAWFFYASSENYLSFVNDKPAHGFLAQVFSAPVLPGLLLAPAAPGLPMLAVRPLSRLLRALSSQVICEDSAKLDVDVTQWHTYGLIWQDAGVTFAVDGQSVFHTPLRPRGRLGLVIWIDNQFAGWHPDGRVRMGTLANAQAQMEIEGLSITQ